MVIGSMLIMIIPLFSVLLIGFSMSYMDSVTPLKVIMYAGIPSAIAILVFIFDRD